MARLATSAVHFCQRLQELYPQKLVMHKLQETKQSEQSSPFRRWTTGSGAGSSYRHHDHRNMYNKQISEGATPMTGNSSSGGVARWSLGLEHLLADPAGAAAFEHYLSKEFAAENIRFWWSCEQYSSVEDASKRAELAKEIWQKHLAEGASEPVNVDASARKATALRLYLEPSPADLFQQAQKQIFNVMKFDSYPRFLRSGVHAECARADLSGLPQPYAPRHHRNNEHDDSTPTKLKKSASNASERRRSGGASLLPWKLRAASRDRAQTNDNQPVDVVKSSQSAPGQCSLCRVVLPDGATSVVGVDETITVKKLVDKLLERRNLRCNTYDVLLKDGNQGESTTISPSSPSSCMGGLVVSVERRAVVRVCVGGRCVAVRCGAARRLRHVLRPVLARYLPPPHPHTAVLSGGVTLHPDTVMQELDGARLQIVEVSDNGEYRTGCESQTEREDDVDSLSDLALRLQDDSLKDADTQSVSTGSSTGRSRDCGATMAGVLDTCGGALPLLPAPNNAGRVRAALRPGPPLHHHPPDFLENLRETQRQRLQTKGETAATPSSPRTPPPLPPKPAHRPPPTLV